MQQMPDEWQERMVDLLEEYNKTYPNLPYIDIWITARRKGKFIKVPSWLENYRYPEQEKINSMRGSPYDPPR